MRVSVSNVGAKDYECYIGKGTTFYSWLNVSPTASTADIGRAYRKKSVQLQCVTLSLRLSWIG